MKIRKAHPMVDRLKLLVILLMLLFLLLALAQKLEQRRWKSSTMDNFFQTAMKPVGTTMYIWGGGWDVQDAKAGEEATRMGVSPMWKTFADMQDENYDFEKHRWEREHGLDCSGYVGWVVYNTFETENGKEGYVTQSTDIAETYASWGWGAVKKNPKEFLPGDIVSMQGHVWICLGTCADESVVLVHSSPPGVMVCGTSLESSKTKSIAVQLAEEFMSKYYPEWYKKYPNCEKPHTYLDNVMVFRWNTCTFTDAEQFQNMSGEAILEYLKNSRE